MLAVSSQRSAVSGQRSAVSGQQGSAGVRRRAMTVVRSALIQAFGSMSMEENVERQIAFIGQAAERGAQITCLQELSTGPYFCQVQDPKFYEFAEPVPDGPTIR